jgi:hypothetical protein
MDPANACYDPNFISRHKMGKTLLQKVWELHTVRSLPTGQTQLFVGLHLVHEVTSPQAFDALRARGVPSRPSITSCQPASGVARSST